MYVGLRSEHTGTAGSPGTMVLLNFGMLPSLSFLFKREFENTRASCTVPGHLTTTSKKKL